MAWWIGCVCIVVGVALGPHAPELGRSWALVVLVAGLPLLATVGRLRWLLGR